jgi:hypothetical protein
MKEIVCSLEDWDSILGYHRPNGSSKTWYLKELKTLSIPLMWGRWNVFTEDGEMFENGHIKYQTTPNHSNLITYLPKEKIGKFPHIYIINVYTNTFFTTNENIGFKCISEDYLNDIRNGKAKILMFFIYEGYSGAINNNDFETIEKWRIDSDLPINSVYYVNGNLLSEEIIEKKNLGFIAKGIHYFEPWNKYDGEILSFKPIDNKYLFLSYNRATRNHRIRFIVDLFEKNIIDKGLISCNKLFGTDFLISNEVKEFFETKTPMFIDTMPELKYNLAVNITKEDYERTFISIVTETLVDDGTLFFSEKIWKPIMVGHPFMIYGNQGSLKYLKSLGFKTFSNWIDESYDDEPDRDVRSTMIVNELEKLSFKTKEELIKIREEMKETCLFNYKFYKKYYYEKYGNHDISKTIDDVLIEMWTNLKNNNQTLI